MAGRLAAHLEEKSPDPLDVAHTLLDSRAQLEHRAVVVAADQRGAPGGSRRPGPGQEPQSLAQAKAAQGPLAFLLSGQGSQRPRMGMGLYESFPAYAQAFDAACDALANEGIEVGEALQAEPGSELSETLERTDLTQASLFALQVGLYSLTASFGVAPDYLLGHSVGEISAAHLAGVFDLQQAAKLLAARAKAMAALPEGGAMALIRASEAEVTESLAPYEGAPHDRRRQLPDPDHRLRGRGGPRGVAGRTARGRQETRTLQVSHAFHSHRMEPMLGEL